MRLIDVVMSFRRGWKLSVSGFHQFGVEDEADAGRGVVHQGEAGYGAGSDGEGFPEEICVGEGEPLGANLLVKLVERQGGVVAGGDEDEVGLLVLHEEVLGVGAFDAGLDLAAFGGRCGWGACSVLE